MNNINIYSLAYPLYNLLNQLFCICECTKDEHLNDNECYGLHYNNVIYSACRCKKFRPLGINLNLYSEMEFTDENSIQ